jgi:hypothetical protein
MSFNDVVISIDEAKAFLAEANFSYDLLKASYIRAHQNKRKSLADADDTKEQPASKSARSGGGSSAAASAAASTAGAAQPTSLNCSSEAEQEKEEEEPILLESDLLVDEICIAMKGSTYITLKCGEWCAQLKRSDWLFENSVYLREAFQEPDKTTQELVQIPFVTFIGFHSFVDFLRQCKKDKTLSTMHAITKSSDAHTMAEWILLAEATTFENIGTALVTHLEDSCEALSPKDCYELGAVLCNSTLLLEAAYKWEGPVDVSPEVVIKLAPFWKGLAKVTCRPSDLADHEMFCLMLHEWSKRNPTLKFRVTIPSYASTIYQNTNGLYVRLYERYWRKTFCTWMAQVGSKHVWETLASTQNTKGLITQFNMARNTCRESPSY